MILKAYKYRIYPTKSQRELIEKHFGSVRFIYNWGLEKKIKYYTEHKKTLSTIVSENIEKYSQFTLQ